MRARPSTTKIPFENVFLSLLSFSELALAARAPSKKFHRCVLLGHSFGGLVLENTISHRQVSLQALQTLNS